MQNQIRQQEEVEKQVLEKIKMKMDRIKATHDKQNNKDNHFDGMFIYIFLLFDNHKTFSLSLSNAAYTYLNMYMYSWDL